MDNKPWLKNYDKGVPATLQPYLQQTIVDVMRETVSQRPDHMMLYFKGTKLSYGQNGAGHPEQEQDVFDNPGAHPLKNG